MQFPSNFRYFFDMVFDESVGGVSNVIQDSCITSGPPKIIDFGLVVAPSNTDVSILRKRYGAKRNGAAALRFIKLLQAQPGH